MKLVVDSNCLRDDCLHSFLKASTSNLAVLSDYAAMEALKGDALIGMYESMRILAQFPSQVQVLKTTNVVCGLSGISRGLQRRLVDVPQTNDFELFCWNLANARGGETSLVQQLHSLGIEARNHLTRIESDANAFAKASIEAARLFSREEIYAIISSRHTTPTLLHKLLLHVMQLSAFIFSQHPAVRRTPSYDELINTYIFRSSLCHVLLGFQYESNGGTSGKSPAKIRNDMVDSLFATYATFFDGLLSKDRRTNWLFSATTDVLRQLRLIYPR